MNNHEKEQCQYRFTVEERLAVNRQRLESIAVLMSQEREKDYAERKQLLLVFLAVEQRTYSAIVAELEQILSG